MLALQEGPPPVAHFRAHVALRGALAQLSAAHTFVARVAHVWRTVANFVAKLGQLRVPGTRYGVQ